MMVPLLLESQDDSFRQLLRGINRWMLGGLLLVTPSEQVHNVAMQGSYAGFNCGSSCM